MEAADELAAERSAMMDLLASAGVQLPAPMSDSDDEDEDAGVEVLRVGNDSYEIRLAQDDGSVKGTLFACRVWNGAVHIAEYVAAHADEFAGASVVELGAACALPSLALGETACEQRLVGPGGLGGGLTARRLGLGGLARGLLLILGFAGAGFGL